MISLKRLRPAVPSLSKVMGTSSNTRQCDFENSQDADLGEKFGLKTARGMRCLKRGEKAEAVVQKVLNQQRVSDKTCY